MLIERLEMALVRARSSIFADRIRRCDLVVVRVATWEVMEGQLLEAKPLLKHLTVALDQDLASSSCLRWERSL